MTDKDLIVRQILIGLTCGSLGFGTSQLTIVEKVSAHEVRICEMAKAQDVESTERHAADDFTRSEISDERSHTDKAITELVALVRQDMAQSQEIVTLLKVQNQLNQSK